MFSNGIVGLKGHARGEMAVGLAGWNAARSRLEQRAEQLGEAMSYPEAAYTGARQAKRFHEIAVSV